MLGFETRIQTQKLVEVLLRSVNLCPSTLSTQTRQSEKYSTAYVSDVWRVRGEECLMRTSFHTTNKGVLDCCAPPESQ